MATTSAAMAMTNPADAARAPEGPTKTTTGVFDVQDGVDDLAHGGVETAGRVDAQDDDGGLSESARVEALDDVGSAHGVDHPLHLDDRDGGGRREGPDEAPQDCREREPDGNACASIARPHRRFKEA